MAPTALVSEAAVPLLDADGQIREPLLVVDLDAERGHLTTAVAAAASSDRILVGATRRGAVDSELTPLVNELDLTLVPVNQERTNRAVVEVTDLAAVEAVLHASAVANPHASTVLARLLHWTSALSMPDALDAESLAYSTLLGGPEFRRWLASRRRRPPPPPTARESVIVERAGAEFRITLNRPERRNAYGRELRDALVSALQVAVWDTTIGRVVIDAIGPVFCAGGDLDEFGTTPDLVTAHFVRTCGSAARLLYRLADRTQVRLHGTCLGAGIELPAYANRVIAAPDTRLCLPELGMGLIPGAGGTVSIPRRIGRWRTLYLALTGVKLDTERALAWALINEIR